MAQDVTDARAGVVGIGRLVVEALGTAMAGASRATGPPSKDILCVPSRSSYRKRALNTDGKGDTITKPGTEPGTK